MTIDQMREIARGANPVPDPDVLEPIASPDLPDREGSGIMSTTEFREKTSPQKPEPRKAWAFAAAAAVVLAFGGLIFYATRADTTEDAVGVEPSATAVAEGWAAALNDGNAEAALGFLHPDEREGMTELVDFFSAAYAGHYTNEDCAETSAGVECTLVIDDPLMVVLELDHKEFIAGFSDGYLSIQSVGDRMGSLTAFAAYLFDYQPEEYESTCSPVAVGATPLFGSTLAATADCGAVYLEFVDEAALWVEAGRPLP